MPAIARNAPCPCGSGRKHKLCCLAPLEHRDAAWRASNRLCEQVYVAALAIGSTMWTDRDAGELLRDAWSDLWLGEPPAPDPEPVDLSLLAPWFAYHWKPIDDRRVIEVCLEAAPQAFSTAHREWIDASLAASFSLLEVLEVVRGESIRVRDLLLDEERLVYERSASKSVPLRSILFARTVEFRGVTTLDGLYPRIIPPAARDSLLESANALLGRKSSRKSETLRACDVELFALYIDAMEMTNLPRQSPTLTNTDGELVVMCELRWPIQPRRVAEVRRRLSALRLDDPLESLETEASSRWGWSRSGNAQHASWTNTVLGSLRIDGTILLGECNSEGRMTRLARIVESACGDLLDAVDISRTTQAQLRQRAATRPAPAQPKPPSAPERRALAEFLAQHYDTWPDQQLPALAGKTPRQAVTTAKGRRQVDALVREMEHHTSTTNMDGAYDFGRLRRSLGL